MKDNAKMKKKEDKNKMIKGRWTEKGKTRRQH